MIRLVVIGTACLTLRSATVQVSAFRDDRRL